MQRVESYPPIQQYYLKVVLSHETFNRVTAEKVTLVPIFLENWEFNELKFFINATLTSSN